MTQAVKKTKLALDLPAVRGWTGSDIMMVDAHRIQEAFLEGTIDPESARLLVGNMRNAIALLALKLDHAKLSKRIEIGSTTLPAFQFKSLSDDTKKR